MDSTGASALQGKSHSTSHLNLLTAETRTKAIWAARATGQEAETGTAQRQARQANMEQFQGQQLVVLAPDRDGIALRAVSPERYCGISTVLSTPSNLIIQNPSDGEAGSVQPEQIQGTKNITEEMTRKERILKSSPNFHIQRQWSR